MPALLCICGCTPTPVPPAASAPLKGGIAISSDGRGFDVAGTQTRFVPWGFNYDRDFQSRLIEEYWEADWKTVESDFREMKSLGANVVRVHLQYARFMDGINKPNRSALFALDRLLNLAEREKIYLDITGLSCYRKSDTPTWYDDLDEKTRWIAQANFWDAIAARCASSSAVFCYDLMNEPMVPASPLKKGQWLHPSSFGGFSYVQYIALDPGKRPRPQVAKAWVKQMVAAIRKRDRSHLITVGLLPNSVGDKPEASGFDPATIAPEIDFISVHMYPSNGKVKDSIKTLAGFSVGKPVVIEEMFPLNCDAGELSQFIMDSQPYAAGWIGFYWGQTPEQLKSSTQPSAAIMRSYLDLFQKMKPR